MGGDNNHHHDHHHGDDELREIHEKTGVDRHHRHDGHHRHQKYDDAGQLHEAAFQMLPISRRLEEPASERGNDATLF